MDLQQRERANLQDNDKRYGSGQGSSDKMYTYSASMSGVKIQVKEKDNRN